MSNAHQYSILNKLEEQKVLRKLGKIIQFSEENKTDLARLSQNLNTPPFSKKIIFIPEYEIDLLKFVFFETCYAHIDKKCKSVKILTDYSGKSFILEFFSEYNTEKYDLNKLLLKDHKNDISILLTKTIPSKDVNSINLFYRTLGLFIDNEVSPRSVCLITLLDIYKLGEDYQEYLSELKNKGWEFFNFSDSFDCLNDAEIGIPVECNFPQLLLDKINTIKRISENGAKFLEESLFFYYTVCIPMELCYDEWDVREDNNPLYPSKRITSNSLMSIDEKKILSELFISIEETLQEENSKFLYLENLFSLIPPEGGKQCVILPSNYSVESLVDFYQGNKDYFRLKESEWIALTEQQLFFKLSHSNQRYHKIVFPFIPSPFSLVLAKKFSDQIVFILYPGEIAIYKELISESQDLHKNIKKIINPNKDSESNEQITITKRKDVYKRYKHLLREISDNNQDIIDRPLSQNDSDQYTFRDSDGKTISVRGFEDLVRYRSQYTKPHMRYKWIHPYAAKVGDVIISVPDDVRKELLIEHMKNELLQKAEDIELYIEYLACWKKALHYIESQGISIAGIHSKLKTRGLNRDIQTIKGWFKGLSDDPIKCALDSLLSQDMNIGPRNAEDILKFGEAFALERVMNNYKEIFNSMKFFREILRRKGFNVSYDIIHKLDDSDFRNKCILMKVKRIKVESED